MEIVIRSYSPEDLGRILAIWQQASCLPTSPDGLTIDQLVDVMNTDAAVTLVAEAGGDIVGMAVGTYLASVGRIEALAVTQEQASGVVVDQLFEQLEGWLAEQGVRHVDALVRTGHPILERFEDRGYKRAPEIGLISRRFGAKHPGSAALAELGGRMIDPSLWNRLKGMEEPKSIIERRVILPLAEPELAGRHAVAPPRAIVLFGPPGTGKTTFAKGIASRLGWAFIEIEPSQLAGEGSERQAKLLADSFDLILALPSAVVFVDEVEDIASVRHEERRASPNVTNEFLKQIPRFREVPRHLLVCATNWVSGLDLAFLRPGRFDYVLPVGPPDEEARSAILRRYVEEITDEDIDVASLVEATELFTPADIEFAARQAAQRAFEREHFEGVSHRATTEEFLRAIRDTRPSLTLEMVQAFSADTERFARY